MMAASDMHENPSLIFESGNDFAAGHNMMIHTIHTLSRILVTIQAHSARSFFNPVLVDDATEKLMISRKVAKNAKKSLRIWSKTFATLRLSVRNDLFSGEP